MNVKQILGANVRLYRKRLHLSEKELAEKLGIGNKHLSEIETGIAFVSADMLEKFCRILGVSPSALFYTEDEKAPSPGTLDKINAIVDDELEKAVRSIRESIHRSV
jgi:transcriptional regulator with XRE-family HTH domain